MKKYWCKLLVLCSLCSLIIITESCKSKKKDVKIPAPAAKINKNAEPIHIKRYEKALFSLDKNNLPSEMAKLSADFYFFLGDEWQSPQNINKIKNFIADPNIIELYSLTLKKYPDLTQFENELAHSFAIFRSYFPQTKIPDVYSYVSGLDADNSIIYVNDGLAVALDLFLGKDSPAYRKVGFPKYKTEVLSEEYMLPCTMKAVATSFVAYDENDATLLNQMILEGKKLYFLDVVLPEIADYLKIGYVKEKYEWCVNHEGQIWAFLIDSQAMFSSDFTKINRLINDAPFTTGLPQESPGRIGAYIGWQIVREYMANNSVSLPALMKNTNAQDILTKSNYKPKK